MKVVLRETSHVCIAVHPRRLDCHNRVDVDSGLWIPAAARMTGAGAAARIAGQNCKGLTASGGFLDTVRGGCHNPCAEGLISAGEMLT